MKRNIKFYLAFICAKICSFGLKLFKRNASYLPGFIALKIDPDYLYKINVFATIIGVTGTNGKTSTSNLLTDFLFNQKKLVLNNSFGSNTEAGIVSLLIKHSKQHKVIADYIVLEIDERSSIHILKKIKLDYLIVTNIFRDSCFRNAHPDYIISILNKAINPDTTLVLNADDLSAYRIKPENKRVYFSFDYETKHVSYQSNVNDNNLCPICQKSLVKEYVRYHQIGKYHCSHCQFKTSDALVSLKSINNDLLEIMINHQVYQFNAISKREFDLYNQLSLITILYLLGFKVADIIFGQTKLKIVDSRYRIEKYKDLEIIASLAKDLNPIATSRVLEDIVLENKRCAIIFIQFDTGFITKGNYDDSKNRISEFIGWLYEVDYSLLKSPNIGQVVVAGKRYLDGQVACLLAGVDSDKLKTIRMPLEAVDQLDLKDLDAVYILFDIFNYSFVKILIEKLKVRLDHES